MALKFERETNKFFIESGATAYSAIWHGWMFLIIGSNGKWTTSYRAIDPSGSVSASSTIRGPFNEFGEAEKAADIMLSEIRQMS